MSTIWRLVGLLLMLLAVPAWLVVSRLCRYPEPVPAEDVYATDTVWAHVDWDAELEQLLWDCGVRVGPVFVPVSDEELLDLADVVGVRR